MTTVHNQKACPSCGYEFDCSECFSEPTAKPGKGDFTICLNCATILRYANDDLDVRCLIDADKADMMPLKATLYKMSLAVRSNVACASDCV